MLYLEETAKCTAGARNAQQQDSTVCTGSMHPVLTPGGAVFGLHYSYRRGRAPHSPQTTAVRNKWLHITVTD